MVPAADAAPVDFDHSDRRLEAVGEARQIPDMAVAVVGAGRALHVRGYGVDSGELHWSDHIAESIDQGKERVGALSLVAGGGFVVRGNGPRDESRPVAFKLSCDANALAMVATEARSLRRGMATDVAKQ